jgi:hypothetical protein
VAWGPLVVWGQIFPDFGWGAQRTQHLYAEWVEPGRGHGMASCFPFLINTWGLPPSGALQLFRPVAAFGIRSGRPTAPASRSDQQALRYVSYCNSVTTPTSLGCTRVVPAHSSGTCKGYAMRAVMVKEFVGLLRKSADFFWHARVGRDDPKDTAGVCDREDPWGAARPAGSPGGEPASLAGGPLIRARSRRCVPTWSAWAVPERPIESIVLHSSEKTLY